MLDMLTVSWQPIMKPPSCTQHSIDKPQGPCEDDLVGQMQPADIADSERDALMRAHTHAHTNVQSIHRVETDGAKNKPSKIFNLLTQKTTSGSYVCTSRG